MSHFCLSLYFMTNNGYGGPFHIGLPLGFTLRLFVYRRDNCCNCHVELSKIGQGSSI